MVLLVGLAGIFVVLRSTRPPFGVGSFRWVYLAWACLLAASSVWTLTRDVRFSAEEAGADNFVRLAFLALGVLIILYVGAMYRFVLLDELAAGALAAFFVFALWGLASTLWSVSPAGTLYKATEYGAMVVLFALAASLLRTSFGDPRKRLLALKSVFDWHWMLVFLLLVSVYVGVVVWPEYAILENYRAQVGVFGFSINGVLPGISGNGVGQLGAILATVAFVRILHKPGSAIVFAPVLVFSLVTAILTQSRSPLLAFLVAVVVVMIASRRFGLLTLLAGVSGAVLLSPIGDTAYDFLRRGQNEGDLTSLTGRVDYWGTSLQAVSESWLNGYGAYAGGRYVLQSFLGVGDVSTVHSAYVEVVLDTGVVGLALLLAGLIGTWISLFRLRSHVIGDPVGRLLWLECLGIFALLTVRSFFSVSTFVWSFQVLTFGLVLIFVTVARRQSDRRRDAGAPAAQPVPATRR